MAPCFAHHGCRSNSSVPSLIVQYLRFRNISSTRIAKLPVLRSTQPLPNPTVMDATGSAKEEERKRHQRKRNPKKRTLFFGRVSRLGLTPREWGFGRRRFLDYNLNSLPSLCIAHHLSKKPIFCLQREPGFWRSGLGRPREEEEEDERCQEAAPVEAAAVEGREETEFPMIFSIHPVISISIYLM